MVGSEIQDVKKETAVCFTCHAPIPEAEFYCVDCINSGRRRCFVCRGEFRSYQDHWECHRCRAPLTPHELRFVHREREGDVFASELTAHLRTTAAWNLEALRRRVHRRRRRRGQWPTPGQLELQLWGHAHSLLDVQREYAVDSQRTNHVLLGIVAETAARVLADEKSNEQFARRDIDHGQ